jgi:hypothetical protein
MTGLRDPAPDAFKIELIDSAGRPDRFRRFTRNYLKFSLGHGQR